ncbi:cation diffusion facilitator family transporter [Sulfobacillus acidophilus DSM 10332]|uniref:Cation diffusion facilitator family transporter n=1 Tax=Sulfobacillus acidophilus (strain ATCC 700253 / DSM 10332 / NAL) TaxID=679936 RepID=G8TVN2_SULAD|nr:cation diffusion facilitator family transporter [Sulfobacillus acidophilus DSM 10332]
MAHHQHAHHLSPERDGRPLMRAIVVTALLIGVKAIGAVWAHSLALWADAAHSLTDLAAMGLSWYAWRLARRPPTERLTFGYGRTEVLAALVNSLALTGLAILLLWESWHRWRQPVTVAPGAMLITAAIALAADIVLVLGFNRQANVNIRSVSLHLASDALGSLAILVGAVLIARTGWTLIDPILTVVIAIFILWGTWGIIAETTSVLLEATPPGIRLSQVIQAIEDVPAVERVHDVHVWSVSQGQNALACHVEIRTGMTLDEGQAVLEAIQAALLPLGIEHMTIQFETASATHHDPGW